MSVPTPTVSVPPIDFTVGVDPAQFGTLAAIGLVLVVMVTALVIAQVRR